MIRIGVTGHRVLSAPEELSAGIESALSRIDQCFPGHDPVVISALAEGADRIVVRHVLKRPRATLIVPLPLPESEYMTDFTSEASRAEFQSLLRGASVIEPMPRAGSREEAYLAAGVFVLENSDVLIAIWDGRPAQGPGGTGDIVARARRRKLPIAWVHAGSRAPGSVRPTALDHDQGLVTFENI